MKRYEPTIEWGETEALGRVTASVRLKESSTGSVAKVEEVVDELNTARCEAAQARVDLIESIQQREAVRQERDKLNAECERLRRELATGVASHKAEYTFTKVLETRALEIDDLKAERDEARKDVEKLKTHLDLTCSNFNKEIKDVVRQRSNLYDECDKLAADCYQLRFQLKAAESKAECSFNMLLDERDALKAERVVLMDERDKLNELLGLTRSNNAEEIIGLRECLRAVTADRDRLLLDETHEGVMRERDVLRSAMRIAAPVVRGHNKIHAGDIVRRLNGFTPEQRAACGWPDPEPQKTMTWGEALAALTSGKLVRRQSWAMPDGLESPCGRIRWASILHGWTPDTADFSATDWEICS